jgi:SpoIID/LytB domain protein
MVSLYNESIFYMRYWFKNWVVILCFGFSWLHASDAVLPVVRVERASSPRKNITWVLHTDTSFVMNDAGRNKKGKIREQDLTLDIKKRSICVNGKRIPSRNIAIESTNGVIWVNGVAYRGMVVVQGGRHPTFTVRGALELSTSDAVAPSGEQAKIAETKKEEESISAQQHASCTIKVLLDQLDAGRWQFKSRGGFVVWDTHYKKKMDVDQVLIYKKDQQLYVNNKKCNDAVVHIIPCSGHALCNGTSYHGSFLIVQHKGQFHLVNAVDLEDYVCGVLGSESLPGWPLEVQKVFAIACRSYALAMASRADKLRSFYHMKNTNAHQTYEGSHSNSVLRKAVEDTRGIFMAYNNEPVTAMYDVCCGGVIPAHIKDFNFGSAAYLARNYACTHCKPCKVYAWSTTWRLKDFEELVSKKHAKISDIKSIMISKKDKAGLVREVILKSATKQVAISGKKLYSIMKGVKSFCFKIQKKGNRVFINGHGYGHHMGLCQWGAREMVRKGYDHKSVLQFYYPGITFARMA